MLGASLIGKTLRGHYYITDKLGEGGIGETYLALDIDQPESYQCVIKRLKPQNMNQSAMKFLQQCFNREAIMQQRLGKHDQIPRLLAYFEEDNEFFLTQEFIEGNSLRTEFSIVRQFNENQIIFLLRDILEVLEFVHQNNVIHRDLKPENLIRRKSDNKIVLIDFGAVKEVSTQIFNTQGQIVSTTFVIGTPGYMPVEQLQQNPMLCSDIYAVGIIALEALTGLEPLKLLDAYTGEIVWRNRIQVRDDLANVLDKMVARHPKLRYQSASETLQVVRELAQTVVYSPQSPPIQQIPSTPPIAIPTPLPVNKYAGFGRRLAADFIDRTILIIGTLIIDFTQFGAPNSSNGAEFTGRLLGYYIMLAFLYCPVMESSQTQATLGKMALAIVVTDLNGNRLSWEQAVKRHISKLLSYITIFIGFFMCGVTEKKQALHDKVSGCLIVRKD